MTSQARADEAGRVTQAFQLALAEIGAQTITDALRIWAGVPVNRMAQVAEQWLEQAIHLILTRRNMSRDLAIAYYRLVRALRTGRTVDDPRHPTPSVVTLSQLRYQFSRLAPSYEGDDDDQDIPVDRLKDWDEDLDQNDADAEQEAGVVLQALGPDNLGKKLKQIDTNEPAKVVDQSREDAHNEAGARQAAASARIVENGGRGTVWSAIGRDGRALGWIRISTTGDPCGWCAMLISRGFVKKSPLYTSKVAAQYSDGDLYHDHDHCIAEPVFSADQLENDPRYEQNREMARLWPVVTKGLSGKDALSAWRKYIRQRKGASR